MVHVEPLPAQFTMSLVVAELAFGGPAGTLSQAKAVALCAPLVAAAWGSAVLSLQLIRRTRQS